MTKRKSVYSPLQRQTADEIVRKRHPWSGAKSVWTLRIDGELEHVVNIMSLHFGISKNAVAIHALQLLWSDVAPTISKEDLKKFEERLHADRLWRLAKNEAIARRARQQFLKKNRK